MSGPNPTRPSMLLALRDVENSEAWEQFVQVYAPLIYGFSRQRGLQDIDAADVTQEVMTSVVRAIQGFEYDPTRGRFRNWLLTITRNELNNFFKRRIRSEPSTSDTGTLERLADQPSGEDLDLWDREYRRRLFEWAARQVSTEVHSKTWEAFRLTAIENCAGEEVAAKLGLTVGGVYVAKSRVIARLRELVASVADDPPDFAGMVP